MKILLLLLLAVTPHAKNCVSSMMNGSTRVGHQVSGTVVAVVDYADAPFMSFVTDNPAEAYSAMVSQAVAHFGLPDPSDTVEIHFAYTVDTEDFPASNYEWTVKNDVDLKAAFVWFARAGLTAAKLRVMVESPTPTVLPTTGPSSSPTVVPTLLPSPLPTAPPVEASTCGDMGNGEFTVMQPGTASRQAYCKDGYTLVAKISTANNVAVWGYRGTGWGEGNYLNAGDLSENEGDAKYEVWDDFAFTTYRAILVTANNKVWDQNTSDGTAQTPFTFFNTEQLLNSGTDLQTLSQYDNQWMSKQNYGWYGINIKDTSDSTHHSYGMRWGFIWNEHQYDAGSDALAGMGMVDYTDNHRRSETDIAAGDFFSCCGTQAPNGKRKWFVLILGKE